jgi:hypothetical protein
MSARTIKNTRERLITIFITPLMSCSARLPVYTLLIAIAIPDEGSGFFNTRGLLLMALYLLGFVAALFSALLMKFWVKTKERSIFIMELPVYRMPQLSVMLYTMVDKVKVFVLDAGKIIIAISIVLWVLSSYGPGNRFAELDKQYASPETIALMGETAAADTLDGVLAATITTLTDGSTITPAFTDSCNFTVTLGGNRTLANPTGLVAGQSGSIFIVQDGTGSRTLAYGSYFKFSNGTAPTLTTTASAVDVLAYYVESSTRITAKLVSDVK